jgi:hypothetical protein
VLESRRAIPPLTGILVAIIAGSRSTGVGEERRSCLQDLADHVTPATEQVEDFRLLSPLPGLMSGQTDSARST